MDRDSYFIFGDVVIVIVMEMVELVISEYVFDVFSI